MPAMPERDKRLLLVDGNSIINRSYFALAGRGNLTAPDGTPTGALNTYLNTLSKFMDQVRPTHVCTLFDVSEKTFRHKMYDGYKAKRKGMPDDLAVQMPLLKETLDAMNVVRYELPGFEADDLIGTLARRGEKEGFAVYILSGDKDDFQLIDSNTVVLMPVNKTGKTATEVYDAEALAERYQIGPEEFITLKAIMGDPSDNIPGVRGIGEKGAIELVMKFRTLDSIYAHMSELTPGLQKKLLDNRDMAYLSYELSKIVCDAPISVSLDDLKYAGPDREKLASVFYRLGFRSQLKKWNLEDVSVESGLASDSGSQSVENAEPLPTELPAIVTNAVIKEFASAYDAASAKGDFRISIDMPLPAVHAGGEDILSVCLSASEIYAFSGGHIGPALDLLASRGVGQDRRKLLPAGHSIKSRFRGLAAPPPFSSCFDVEVAGYILNQIEGGSPSFEMLYEHATKEAYPRFAAAAADSRKKKTASAQMDLFADSSESPDGGADAARKTLEESAWRALLVRRIMVFQTAEIEALHLEKLIYEIEMPLVLRLDQMERDGVYVDRDVLREIHDSFDSDLARLSARIYEESGTTFNILSPKQLGHVLFEKLGLPSGRKSSSGAYSTDSDELMRLIDAHPAVRDIIDYRQIAKLDSTFVLGLQKVIDPSDGRVHTSFSQVMTNTGRLSSSEPNLQNIPIRTGIGSQIRKAFVAPQGRILVDADYSQIELRLLAHLSQDENMMNAFLRNEDIHTNTAARIFNVPKEMVQPYMRAAAKTVNFSIVYGVSDFGLSQGLGVSFQEAHHYIEHYYMQYPKIREYLDSLKQMGYEKGYVETLFGRRRIVRELASPNRNIRMFGERAAMNTPVQGTAADIIKIAMNRVGERLEKEKLKARLILQVHDELIVECTEDLTESVSQLLKEEMEGAAALSVPLTAEVSSGRSWYDCKI